MRTLLLACTTAAGLLAAGLGPVAAQTATPPAPMSGDAMAPMSNDGARPGNDIGTGNSMPMSNSASNTSAANSKSQIAPRLPSPGIESGTPEQFLKQAQQAIRAGRTGQAQEALERAETRALDRSTAPGQIAASNDPLVMDISGARKALGRGNRGEALRMIQAAMGAGGAMGHDAMGKDAMGKDAMGHDAMGKDAMGHDAMGKDAMGHDAMAPGAMTHDAMTPGATTGTVPASAPSFGAAPGVGSAPSGQPENAPGVSTSNGTP